MPLAIFLFQICMKSCRYGDSRKGRTHRAIIRTPEGGRLPECADNSEDKKKEIRYVRINQDENWAEPILRTLKFNYSNSV